jgi:hypothetical protein
VLFKAESLPRTVPLKKDALVVSSATPSSLWLHKHEFKVFSVDCKLHDHEPVAERKLFDHEPVAAYKPF